MADTFLEHDFLDLSQSYRLGWELSCSRREPAPVQRANSEFVSSSQKTEEDMSEVLSILVSELSLYESNILSTVAYALKSVGSESESRDEVCRSSATRRAVMSTLRLYGYDAAICQSRWEQAGRSPGGEYEFIDVFVMHGPGAAGKRERIVVDITFKAEFEIARPTGRYSALMEVLPAVFVGKADRLQRIVNIMSDSVKKSLLQQGLQVPPWRKAEYIRSKWFSGCRRITTGGSSSSSSPQGRDSDLGFKEMGKLYIKEVDLQMALRGVEQDLEGKTTAANELEGKVRAANFMEFLQTGRDTSENDGSPQWEPPVKIPRTSVQNGGRVGGLQTILKDSRRPALCS